MKRIKREIWRANTKQFNELFYLYKETLSPLYCS